MKCYVQYSTDYHLLIALSQALSRCSNVVIIGPKSPLSEKVSGWKNIVHVAENSAGFYNYGLAVRLAFCHKTDGEYIQIYSPYILPFYTLSRLDDLCYVDIYRTDEGVGSNANFNHYRKGILHDGRSQIYSTFHAFLKVTFRFLVRKWGGSRDRLLINSNGHIDDRVFQEVENFISIVGRNKSLNSKVVVCTQPGVESEYGGVRGYFEFLSRIEEYFDGMEVCIKKHPRDAIDYQAYKYKEFSGEILEFYELSKSIVIGWSSTTLLTASIFSNCKSVYYIDSKLFRILSPVNKYLFTTRLQRFEV